MLISIETHITCDFPGFRTPYPPSGSAHAFLPFLIIISDPVSESLYTCRYKTRFAILLSKRRSIVESAYQGIHSPIGLHLGYHKL